MLTVPGYQVDDVVHVERERVVLRARRIDDGARVWIAAAPAGRATQATSDRLRREHDRLAILAGEGGLRPLEVIDGPWGPALILADEGGTSLLLRCAAAPLPLAEFLPLGRALLTALGHLHRRGIIHGALRPAAAILTPDRTIALHGLTEARLGDRGQASRTPSELAYLAPEQCGRQGRAIDERSDLYAAGVIFFELLTGQLPFASDDPVEIVHGHLSRPPPPPGGLRPELPASLAAVVLRLLAKAPEERYQSVDAVAADLERCAAELGGRPPAASPADADEPRLALPARIFGQEDVIHAALAAHDRCLRGGREAIVVLGGPGTGKSELLTELVRRRVDPRRPLLFARCPARARPHAPLIAALRQRLRDFLDLPPENREVWQRTLQGAVGRLGALLVPVFPELDLLLGPQPPLVEIPEGERTQRFRNTFDAFVRALVRAASPLLIAIDDFHRLDAASAESLARLFTEPGSRSLLLVAVARGPLEGEARAVLTRIAGAGLPVAELAPRPLGLADATALLRESLGADLSVRGLAERLVAASGGNPHLARLHLLALHERGLITHKGGAWRWSLGDDVVLPEDLGDALAARLAEAPTALRERLGVAALVGPRFEVALLARLLSAPAAEVAESLVPAVAAGLLRAADDEVALTYEFTHDRVLGDALVALAPARQVDLHRRLAGLLRETPVVDDDRAEEILDHLVAAGPRPAERLLIAHLSLQTGRRALLAGDRTIAARHLQRGIDGLPADAWRLHHDLAFGLHQSAVETAHARGARGAAAALFDKALAEADSAIDRAQLLAFRLSFEINQRRFTAALDTGRSALAFLGVRLPQRPGRAAVALELTRLRWHLRGRGPAAFLGARESISRRDDVIHRVMVGLTPAAYFTDLNLAAVILLRLANLTLEHGATEHSAFGVAGYGLVLALHGEHAAAHAAGEAAQALLDRTPSAWIAPKVDLLTGLFTLPWTRPLAEAQVRLARGHRLALETGDTVYACLCGNQVVPFALLAGDPLAAVQERAAELGAFLGRVGERDGAVFTAAGEQLARGLRGQLRELGVLGEDEAAEAALFTAADATVTGMSRALVPLYKAILLHHAGRPDEALAYLRRAEPALTTLAAIPTAIDVDFYAALALAELIPAAGDDTRHRLRAELTERLERLTDAAGHVPANYAARARLIAALAADLDGDHQAVLPAFNLALEAARAQRDPHREGIAAELAARVARRQGLTFLAEHYLDLARAAYEALGAQALVTRLARGPEVGPRIHDTMPSETSQLLAIDGGAGKALDARTVIKATQAIAGEIVLDRLLRELLRIVMENAGARRALLVLVHDSDRGLYIEAEGSVDPERVEVLQACPLDAHDGIPRSLVLFVARAGTTVVLDNAAFRGTFTKDPYIEDNLVRSALCLPIGSPGRVTGVLYLENNLATGVFTADRLALLNQLAAQVAISVENARLYQSLTRARDEAITSDRAKTRFLMNMSHEMRTPLNAILGYAELIDEELEEGSTDGLAEDMGNIRAAAIRLERTLTSILELARVEGGTLVLDESWLDLGALCREVADELAPAFAERQNHLDMAIDEGLRPLLGDRQRLRYCVLALLDNACRFTEGGEITLRLAIEPDGGADWLTLEVRDTGIGIPPAHRSRLFQPFTQVDDSTTRAYEGSGVSLAVTHYICQLMGGTIQVASEVGEGSTFTIRLPMRGVD